MKVGRASSIVGHECNNIANVASNKDVGIYQFTKDLKVGEATIGRQGMVFSSTLLRS